MIRHSWVPKDHIFESADDCLALFPSQPAIKVLDALQANSMIEHNAKLLEFVKRCAFGQYVPIHSDREARDLIRGLTFPPVKDNGV